jgi:sec-independent protein translocase protein TatC
MPGRRVRPVEMTLGGHLSELRRRVVVSLLAVSTGGVVAFLAYQGILNVFLHPYCQTLPAGRPCALYITGPLDGMGLRFKLAAWGGVGLALPVLFWQLWRFVTPALHPKEKRYAVPFVVASSVFFGLGSSIAWLTFPHAIRWLGSIGGPSLQALYNPTSYINLVVLLMVVFGVAFEFPVLLVALELAGVVTPKALAAHRRWAIVAIFAFAAIGTPSSDPFSMLALAIPLYVFFEAAIGVGRLVRR